MFGSKHPRDIADIPVATTWSIFGFLLIEDNLIKQLIKEDAPCSNYRSICGIYSAYLYSSSVINVIQ